jgi:hypothetical protein
MADTPLLVVFPRGQLSADDKAQMREVGIIAVEADDPKSVQQLHLAAPFVSTQINGDAIVRAALKALADGSPQTSGGSITGVGLAAHRFVQLISKDLELTAASAGKLSDKTGAGP